MTPLDDLIDFEEDEFIAEAHRGAIIARGHDDMTESRGLIRGGKADVFEEAPLAHGCFR